MTLQELELIPYGSFANVMSFLNGKTLEYIFEPLYISVPSSLTTFTLTFILLML